MVAEHDGEQLGRFEYAEQLHIVTAAPETLGFGADANQAAVNMEHAPAEKVVEEPIVFLQERTQFRERDGAPRPGTEPAGQIHGLGTVAG